MIHAIKQDKRFFDATIRGAKTFEVRKLDRDYQIGDFLALNEMVDKDDYYPTHTGRCCLVEITYILQDPRYCKEGYCVIGHKPCAIARDNEMPSAYDRVM